MIQVKYEREGRTGSSGWPVDRVEYTFNVGSIEEAAGMTSQLRELLGAADTPATEPPPSQP